MGLRGQGRTRESGYAMAALLVAMAVMAVLMSVAMPVWKHDARRSKEEELIWRGQQYVRAIRLYQARMGALPPNVDALVTGRFLRKKYKDPITNDDFQVLGAGNPIPGQTAQTGTPGAPQTGQAGMMPSTAGSAFGQPTQGGVVGAVIGVVSKSKDESIRLYLGRNHYNEWTFLYVNQQPTAPVGPGGRGQPNTPGRGFPGRGRGFPNGRGVGPVGPNGEPLQIRRGGGGV